MPAKRRLVILLVLNCLLDCGCVSVRYDEQPLKLAPIPVDCHGTTAPSPKPADRSCISEGAVVEKRATTFHGKHASPPAVAPFIPPRPRFHPVPTHPVFLQPVVFEGVPRPIPFKTGSPMPEPIDTPLPEEEEPGQLEIDTSQPLQPLTEEAAEAAPVSLNAPLNTRPVTDGWRPRASSK